MHNLDLMKILIAKNSKFMFIQYLLYIQIFKIVFLLRG